MRKVFSFQKKNRGELDQTGSSQEERDTQDISHATHGIGNGEDTRPYDSLDDCGDCEQQICFMDKVLALVPSAVLARMLCYPF